MGAALLEVKNRKVNYCFSQTYTFKEKDFFGRLEGIKKSLKELLSKCPPIHHFALESLIFVKNPNSLAKLAQARGVILSEILEKNKAASCFEYAPNLVKNMSSGFGHASKESVALFLRYYLKVESFASTDESDAVAIALCHIFQQRLDSQTQIQPQGDQHVRLY